MSKLERYLGEKKEYDIRKAGDGYAVSGPMKPGQKYHQAKSVRSYADDGLFDTYDQAMAHVKKLGGIEVGKIDIQDFEGHINGAKGWLDDIKTQAKHGNIKDAKKGYENLMKNLKLLKKFF
jgi:hypothetical protein